MDNMELVSPVYSIVYFPAYWSEKRSRKNFWFERDARPETKFFVESSQGGRSLVVAIPHRNDRATVILNAL
jgi:hypothetical protein